ncbi:MAG: FeoA family protein [Candidatus Omnitrophica bacterium]|nr:FeoA family protein [Candidatus Omnitrophota bacterium]MDD5042451.1 FeoA family protein [Candidatus Omnitrophota bacterium]MDD5501158.1 FeoA family protein [Candidatus Omnitrophota bacterium]
MERLLHELKPSAKGKIKSIEGEAVLKKKLLDMGVVPGSGIEVLRVAPFGDPVEVRIKGYNLSLRKEEARRVNIEVG